MANPFDFEALYGVTPEAAERLRGKFSPYNGDAVAPVDPDSPEAWTAAGARAPTTVEGGVPRYDMIKTLGPEQRAAAEEGRAIERGEAPKRPSGPGIQFNAFGGPDDPPEAPKQEDPDYVGQGTAQPQASGPAVQASAPVVIPGGWRPSTAETTVKTTGTPEDKEQFLTARDAAAGYGISAAEQRLNAARMDLDIDQLEMARRKEAAQRYDALAQQVALERQQYVDAQKAKLNALSEDLAKDPTTAYWDSKDSGQKVMSFLGVILSGIGAGLTGGPNLALQKIDNEINRSLANRRDTFSRKKTAYQEALTEFGDRSVAVQAAKVAAYDKVAQDMAPLRAQAKGARAQADYEQILQGVMERRAQAYEEAGKLFQTTVEQKDAQRYRDPQVVGGASAKPLENTATLSDGTTVQFQNSEQGNKAVERFQAHAKMQTLYGTALKLRQEVAQLTPGTAAHEAKYKQLQKMASDLIYEESIARGQGVVKEDEMQRGLETSPLLSGLGSRGVTGAVANAVNPFKSRDFEAGDKGIRAAIKQSESEQRALVQAAGGRIVQRGYTPTASGELTPTGRYTGQDLQPQQYLPPAGFKPLDDRKKDIPTAARALAETTPQARRFAPGRPAK